MSDLPIVSIVGRPNTGKSTIFNRLTGGRRSIVDSTPGITRDTLEAEAEWGGRRFLAVDSAGYDEALEDSLRERILGKIRDQVKISDVIIFMLDARDGLTAADEIFAEILRRSGKPCVLVANKVDDFKNQDYALEFYALGMGEPIPMAANSGKNVGDMLDMVVELLPAMEMDEDPDPPLRVAIIGQPNAGKSSLLNRLLGFERAIVHDVPGTTRDAIDTYLDFKGRPVKLVDTAGIRKRFRRGDWLEKLTASRALDALDRAEVALLMCDLDRGLSHQDKSIAGMVQEKGRGLVMVFNKIDLVKDFVQARTAIDKIIEKETPFLKNVPRLYISATAEQDVETTLEKALEIWDAPAEYDLSTAALNSLLQELFHARPPSSSRGKMLKFFYATMTGLRPPRMLLFVNDPSLMLRSYYKYLENGIRRVWPFDGWPLQIECRGRREE